MAITHIQTVLSSKGSSVTSKTATQASTTTAGSLNIVRVPLRTNGVTITSITDTFGNTYQTARERIGYSGDGNQMRVAVWYAMNIGAQASNVITVNFSSACDCYVLVSEYSGAATTSALDTNTNGGEGNSQDPSTGAATATNSGSLYVGLMATQAFFNLTISAQGGSWVERGKVDGASGNGLTVSALDIITSGSQTAAWHLSGSDKWTCIMGIFNPPAASTQPPRSMHQFRQRRNYAPTDREAKMFFDNQRKSHRVPDSEAQRYLINQREQLRRAA